MLEIFLKTLSILTMAVGLAGTVIPMLPGIPLIYLGYIIYGIATSWQNYGQDAMIFWGVVTVLSVLLDYYAGALGAKKYGASKAGVWGAIIGGILGIIFLGFIGIIVGPILGALAAELLAGKAPKEALKSGWGSFIGFLAGSLFKVIIGFIMIGTFIWWIFF